ncbi:FAD-dependent oxidoreductase (plasmid) [Streptomyces sp. CA-142005]|uniref:FAD-dependent oxidoreductase n=1 Tax=Streptomyces sp. CA-142005 TaxID=3240052 RepID=UPI003D93EA84
MARPTPRFHEHRISIMDRECKAEVGFYDEPPPEHTKGSEIFGHPKKSAKYPALPREHGQLLVVGGGPAGVAAATAAARSGARVVLAERSRRLGGQLALVGHTVANRLLWQRWLGWAQAELTAEAVDVRLNTTITEDDCAHFERVILATGARPMDPATLNGGPYAVLSAYTAISRPAPLTGGSVLVIDHGHEWPAVDAAEVLATHGYAVILATEAATPGALLSQEEQEAYARRLAALYVRVLPHHQLLIPSGGEPYMLRDMASGQARPLADNVGTIVIASKRVPDTDLWQRLRYRSPHVQRIGDAMTPRCVQDAIADGRQAVMSSHRSNRV